MREQSRTAPTLFAPRTDLCTTLFGYTWNLTFCNFFDRMDRRRKWTIEQDSLLGKFSDAEVARQIGRSVAVVRDRRQKHKIQLPPKLRPWTPQEEEWLGSTTDPE